MTSLPKCPSRASRASSQPATRTVTSSGLKAPLRTRSRIALHQRPRVDHAGSERDPLRVHLEQRHRRLGLDVDADRRAHALGLGRAQRALQPGAVQARGDGDRVRAEALGERVRHHGRAQGGGALAQVRVVARVVDALGAQREREGDRVEVDRARRPRTPAPARPGSRPAAPRPCDRRRGCCPTARPPAPRRRPRAAARACAGRRARARGRTGTRRSAARRRPCRRSTGAAPARSARRGRGGRRRTHRRRSRTGSTRAGPRRGRRRRPRPPPRPRPRDRTGTAAGRTLRRPRGSRGRDRRWRPPAGARAPRRAPAPRAPGRPATRATSARGT